MNTTRIDAQTDARTVSTRLDRRKARTRKALIDAAVRLVGEGRSARASIQEITDTADVGFGSFYNHFESKGQLFEIASQEVLESWAEMIDRACGGIADPAEVFAVSVRISGRLSRTHPDVARFLTGAGLGLLETSRGLAPRALRDIRAGQAAGRFTFSHAEIALGAVAGGLLALLGEHLDQPGTLAEAAVDELVEADLRLLGVDPVEARRLATLPLPDMERPEPPRMTAGSVTGPRPLPAGRFGSPA